LKTDFNTAKKTLRTSNSGMEVIAVNGCCYGIQNKPDRGDYFKFCGQEFWKFISGNVNLFIEIIEPLGHKSKERNDEFIKSYSRMLNKFTQEFIKDYCLENGDIDWSKIVQLNSKMRK
jgi:hypothetical protein